MATDPNKKKVPDGTGMLPTAIVRPDAAPQGVGMPSPGPVSAVPAIAKPLAAVPAPSALRRPSTNPLNDDGLDAVRQYGDWIKTGAQAVAQGSRALDTNLNKFAEQPQPMAWNMRPSRDRQGFPAVAYSDTAGGPEQLHPIPRGFFRPQFGPGSAGAVARPTPTAAAAPATAGAAGGTPAAVNPNYNPAADNISARNLAAVQKPSFTAPPPSAVVPSNRTIVQPDAQGNQRTLPVGAMVNGVPTFSDGSGSGAIARTMTDDQIKHYGDGLSRADVGAAGNVLASDVTGGGTLTQDQAVNQRLAQIQRPITGSRPSAEQFADSDRNAIAMRDPRSAAGIAARNLAMEAQYGRGGARTAAIQGLQALTAGSEAGGLTAQQGENAQALTMAQGQNAMDQVLQQGQNQLANTALENKGRLQMPRPGQQVTLADGTLGIQDPTTGVVTQSKLADGTTAKAQVTRDDTTTKRANEIMDQIGKTATELSKNAMAPPGAPAGWKPDISELRAQAARYQGLPVVTNAAGVAMAHINGQWVQL